MLGSYAQQLSENVTSAVIPQTTQGNLEVMMKNYSQIARRINHYIICRSKSGIGGIHRQRNCRIDRQYPTERVRCFG